MRPNGLVRNRKKSAVLTATAFHLLFIAQVTIPFICTGGHIPNLSCLLAFKTFRINIFPAFEKASEEEDLFFRGGFAVDHFGGQVFGF